MRHSAVLLTLLLAAPAVVAQEPDQPADYLVYTEEEFLRLPPNTPPGTLVSLVYVKFLRLFDGALKLHGSTIPDNKLVVRDARLIAALSKVPPEDSDGQRLIVRRSNIQIFGAVKAGQVLECTRIKLLENDEQMYLRRMAQLSDQDPKKHADLAAEVRKRADALDEEQDKTPLYKVQRQLLEKARKIEYSQLDALPGGADAWIKFGRRYRDVEVLAKVWAHAGVTEPQRRLADQSLRQLNAHFYLGKWYPYEAFKLKLGMVEVQEGGEKRWVSAERAQFLATIEEKKRELRGGGDFGVLGEETLQEQAALGKVLKGMKKLHVLQVVRKGQDVPWLPVRVDRVRERYEQGTITWEQWVMPDATAVYFYNGIVIQTP